MTAEEGETNAAWVKAEIPLPPAQLLEFLADTERLWRLNPYLNIESWRNGDGGGFALSAANEANDCRLDVAVSRETLPDGGFRFTYDKGLKRVTEFRVEPRDATSLLTVTERYDPVDGPDDPRVKESDKSLVPWVGALRRHIVARARWRKLPGWLWWSETFLPTLPPRSRRTVRLIVWTTALEFLIFLVLVLIWRFAA